MEQAKYCAIYPLNRIQNVNGCGHTNLKDPILWTYWNDVGKSGLKVSIAFNLKKIFFVLCRNLNVIQFLTENLL
jgi:hypothetical protein